MVVAHIVSGLLAVLAGGVVVLTRKGTSRHRLIGWCYVAAMIGLVGTSFGITSARGSLSGFHAISVAATVTLMAGLAMPALLRGRVSNWMAWHLRLMLTSYLMLVMTMIAQYFEVLPLPHPALNAIVFLQVPSVTGFILITRAGRRVTRTTVRPGSA